MPNELDFLSAIQAVPEDTTTRLVFADWLEDHGDPRAALVRAVVETQEWLDPDLAALGEITCPVVPKRFLRGWLAGVETVGRVEVDPQGLLRLVVTTDRARDNVAWRDPGWGWFTEVAFTMPDFRPATTLLARLPVAPQRVVWAGDSQQPSPALGRVTTIDARPGGQVNALLESSFSDRLETLLFYSSGYRWSPRYTPEAEWQVTARLRRLHWGLHQCEWMDAPAQQEITERFLAAPWLRRIEALSLQCRSPQTDFPDLLARSPLGQVRVLALTRKQQPVPSLDRLTRSAFFPLLRTLSLGQLDDSPYQLESGLDRLVSGELRTLRLVAQTRTSILTGVTEALARSPHRDRLRSLALNGWAEPDLTASLTAAELPGLRDLDLSGLLNLGDDLAVHLASWPGLAGLRRLNLANTGISDVGAVALARSRALANLRHLDLRGNPINLGIVESLRAAVGPDRLWSVEV
jgi:uncharacterized protein (TIGR02996 family)